MLGENTKMKKRTNIRVKDIIKAILLLVLIIFLYLFAFSKAVFEDEYKVLFATQVIRFFYLLPALIVFTIGYIVYVVSLFNSKLRKTSKKIFILSFSVFGIMSIITLVSSVMPDTRVRAVDYANYFTSQQFVGLNESDADLIRFPHTVLNNTKNRKYIAFFELFSMDECANIYFGKDAAETGLITEENDCVVYLRDSYADNLPKGLVMYLYDKYKVDKRFSRSDAIGKTNGIKNEEIRFSDTINGYVSVKYEGYNKDINDLYGKEVYVLIHNENSILCLDITVKGKDFKNMDKDYIAQKCVEYMQANENG